MMMPEAANDVLKARDEMTGVEIALAPVVQDLQRRVIRLECERDKALRLGLACERDREDPRGAWNEKPAPPCCYAGCAQRRKRPLAGENS